MKDLLKYIRENLSSTDLKVLDNLRAESNTSALIKLMSWYQLDNSIRNLQELDLIILKGDRGYNNRYTLVLNRKNLIIQKLLEKV